MLDPAAVSAFCCFAFICCVFRIKISLPVFSLHQSFPISPFHFLPQLTNAHLHHAASAKERAAPRVHAESTQRGARADWSHGEGCRGPGTTEECIGSEELGFAARGRAAQAVDCWTTVRETTTITSKQASKQTNKQTNKQTTNKQTNKQASALFFFSFFLGFDFK